MHRKHTYRRREDSYKRLPCDQHALAFFAPAVPGERAVFSDDAMARYRQGNGVGSASVCNGANRFRLADARCQGSISDGRPAGGATEGGPKPVLEMGAAHVER